MFREQDPPGYDTDRIGVRRRVNLTVENSIEHGVKWRAKCYVV